MKLLITGASGAGSTTLGEQLSAQLDITYFDTDDYFWLKTEIPFTEKRPAEERISILRNDLASHDNAIVGGSLVSWGNDWFNSFDLAVFLYVPKDIRISRLKTREYERYGDIIYSDLHRARLFRQFIEWAESYEDDTSTRRSFKIHKEWLSKLNCPVIEINGDTTVQERITIIIDAIRQYKITI